MKIISHFLMMLALIYIACLTGCAKEATKPDSCSSNITYSGSIAPIISTTCAISGCHVANGYRDFSSYALFSSQITEIGVPYFLSRIKPGGGMPPAYSHGPTLSTCDNTKLVTWINAGYPNN